MLLVVALILMSVVALSSFAKAYLIGLTVLIVIVLSFPLARKIREKSG